MRYDSRPMNAKTPDERKIRESRIATDDRLQVAHELFDRHAEEVYRYILAWTGEQASAGDLTTMVLRTAAARMDRLTGDADAAELETRLIALVRAAIIKWHAREPGQGPAPATAVPEESTPLFNGLGELDEGQREVLVLCELLGQELEHAGRLLGYDRSAMEARRHEALGSLWRAMNNAPPDQAVSIWDRLTVSTALRRAAAGWLSPSDEAVLAYVSAQLLSEAPAGVPATAPPHETDAKAPTGAKLVPNRPKVPATVAAAAATVAAATVAQAVALAPAVVLATAPKGPAPTAVPEQPPAPTSAPAAKAAAEPGGPAAVTVKPSGSTTGSGDPAERRERPGGVSGDRVERAPREQARLRRWMAGLALPGGRWGVLGIAAATAAGLGVIAALTIGSPVSGSSQCVAGPACPPPTRVAAGAGNVGEVTPPPTSTTGPGRLGRVPGLPIAPTTSSRTTIAATATAGGATAATRRALATTTSPPQTQPPTTSPPSTIDAPPLCSDTLVYTWHASEKACIGWKNGQIHTTSYFQPLPSQGFNPAVVSDCIVYVTLVSSYGTTHQATFSCKSKATTGEQFVGGGDWGPGRAAGDWYQLHQCVTVWTLASRYSSCDTPQHPITPRWYKPPL